jgi:hypothetical protein
VLAASWAALICASATAAIMVPAIVRAHRAAAVRAGRSDPRDRRSILLRLLVPIWNVYGAGQIVTEVDGMLAGNFTERHRPRSSRTVLIWWLLWVVSAVLTIVVLARGLGASLQAIADTVELHIVVDLAAAAVAAVTAVLMLRWVRLFVGPRPGRYGSWRVAGPDPSRPRLSDTAAAAARRHSGVLPPAPDEMAAPPTAGPPEPAEPAESSG